MLKSNEEVSKNYEEELRVQAQDEAKNFYTGLGLTKVAPSVKSLTEAETLAVIANDFKVDEKYFQKLVAEKGYEEAMETLERFQGLPRLITPVGSLHEETRLSKYDTDFDLENCATRVDGIGYSLEKCVRDLDARRDAAN